MPTKLTPEKVKKTKEKATVLKIPPFDLKSFLSSVGDSKKNVKYEPKQTIFQQGDPSDNIFYIETGSVQLMIISDQGKEGVIANLEAGEFVGEGCLAGQKFHLATATALVPTVAVSIPRATMVKVLHEQPELSDMFTSFLLSRNIQIEADLVDQLFNSSEKRLARALLLLANFGKEGEMEMVIPKVSQEILAARVGTTRGRINFFMNKFKKLGLIEYNGSLKVHSSLMNIIIHD